MNSSQPINLVLFFTRGVSLRTWYDVGMFDREVALYRRLQEQGIHISFITYGDSSDLEFSNLVPGIKICCNRWGLKRHWYDRLVTLLHWRSLKKSHILKTNQMSGADIALLAAQRYKKPLIARCGYMWSKNTILECGAHSPEAIYSLQVEDRVCNYADRIVVTSNDMVNRIQKRFPQVIDKTIIIPNYVDTGLFSPTDQSSGQPFRLCFVGRLSPEKNIESMIQAVDGLDVELDIIGQGPLRESLELLAQNNKRIRFLGRIENNQLPDYLRKASAFILPSHYEGHPKTLIEAMACKLPVIGTDVSGINEIINHGENGLLCQTDPQSIRSTIQKLESDRDLQLRLAERARQFALEHYALDKIVEKERELYHEVLDLKDSHFSKAE